MSRVSGLKQLVNLSPTLRRVVSDSPLPRSDVQKKLWEYIKSKNLQNPKNGREILCDDNLKAVFDKDRVNMFEMVKLVQRHLTKVE